MKKESARRKKQRTKKALSSEYRFDYSKSKPNRFAAKMTEGTVAVVLEPDVAAVFQSSDAVNALLRSVILATSSKEKRPHQKLPLNIDQYVT
jgi:hypothetical protein